MKRYIIGIAIAVVACKKSDSTTDKKTNNGGNNNTIPENTIVFDAAATAEEKRGKTGFLSSITLEAPHNDLILPLKPYIWRVGRANNENFDLYPRLKSLNVEKQLLIVSDFRNILPTSTIFKQYGYGALTDTLASRAQKKQYTYEWDLFNEPNDSLKKDLNEFMLKYWNPAYHAVKAKFPDAIIHGPSITINNSGDAKADSALIYKFIDAAIAHNTLPDYINWHFQIGYNISDWHGNYAKSIKQYLAQKGKTVKGFVAGETVRPGDERNTSPAVLVDVFAAQEIHNITQIHAAWTSVPVYGVATSTLPVLGGLLADTKGKDTRGAWWTYEFYARTKGKRMICKNGESGNKGLVGLGFRDDTNNKISIMLGVRDPLGAQNNQILRVTNINQLKNLSSNGKVKIKVWYNKQTKDAVTAYGSQNLALIKDYDIEIADNQINIPFNLLKWDALLIEITKPE